MRVSILLCILMVQVVILKSQELNCRVVINVNMVQSVDRSIIQEMEIAFAQFLNERKWTSDNFTNDERITCNLLINLSNMASLGNFEASVQILSARPVFGTNYETVLLNFGDRDWTFEYAPSQPLQFNDLAFNNNITSLLAFYAYVIIGLDYDSFEPLGGQQYHQKAWQIVQNAQQSGFAGWDQFGSIRNRYWLAENLVSQQLESVRASSYDYHRLGLDIMRENPDAARNKMFESLQKIQQANNVRPRAILTITYLDSKTDELSNVFGQGNPTVRRNAFNIITSIDPSKSEVMKKLIEN